jgi:hypothetical protein
MQDVPPQWRMLAECGCFSSFRRSINSSLAGWRFQGGSPAVRPTAISSAAGACDASCIAMNVILTPAELGTLRESDGRRQSVLRREPVDDQLSKQTIHWPVERSLRGLLMPIWRSAKSKRPFLTHLFVLGRMRICVSADSWILEQ